MGRGLGLFIIGLIFGGGTGFLVAAAQGVTLDGHDHGDAAQHGGMDHAAHYKPLEVSATGAPVVSALLMPDPISGHTLHVTTQNFTFAPEAASGPHVAGQGHAHVYINGEKLGRLYGAWLHLPALPSGEVAIEVMLNANDHRIFTVDGTPVSTTLTATID